MKTNYTPKPWIYAKIADELVLHGNGGDKLVAAFPIPSKEMGVAYTPDEEDSANLVLIQAAPDLVEACMSALKYLEDHRPKGNIRKVFNQLNEHENGAVKPLRAALKKAGVEL